jgi:hypothetical protein
MNGKAVMLAAVVSVVGAVGARGQAPVITSFQGNGQLTWTNAPGSYLFSIEWAPDLTNGWNVSMGSLGSILSTNTFNSARVPMFYRVRQSSPVFDIPKAPTNMQMNGDFSDWTNVLPVMIDPVGDDEPAIAGDDIHKVYIARDTNFMYFAVTFADGAPFSDGDGHIHFQFSLTTDGNVRESLQDHYEVFTTVEQVPGGDRLVASEVHCQNLVWRGPAVLNYYDASYLGVGADFVEWKVGITDCMVTSGKFAEAWSHYSYEGYGVSDSVVGPPLR